MEDEVRILLVPFLEVIVPALIDLSVERELVTSLHGEPCLMVKFVAEDPFPNNSSRFIRGL
jgi:hypothetical protein